MAFGKYLSPAGSLLTSLGQEKAGQDTIGLPDILYQTM